MAIQIDPASMVALSKTMSELVLHLEEKVASGDVEAIPQLSQLYRHGALGVPVDLRKAYELVKTGMEKGYLKCMILHKTYFLTDDPEYCKQKEEALLFLEHHRTNPYAQAYLGDYYLRKGEIEKGLAMLLETAERGIPFARHQYGMELVNRRNEPHMFIQGMPQLLKAVAQGHLASVTEYGRILCEEDGHLGNRIGGLHMLQLARDSGCSRAADYFRPEPTRFM
jgi:TPR repeat protein